MDRSVLGTQHVLVRGGAEHDRSFLHGNAYQRPFRVGAARHVVVEVENDPVAGPGHELETAGAEIKVHQQDLHPLFGHRRRHGGGDGGFAHAALQGSDDYFFLSFQVTPSPLFGRNLLTYVKL